MGTGDHIVGYILDELSFFSPGILESEGKGTKRALLYYYFKRGFSQIRDLYLTDWLIRGENLGWIIGILIFGAGHG